MQSFGIHFLQHIFIFVLKYIYIFYLKQVNDSSYSTYPDEYKTEAEAKNAAARGALDSIKREELSTLYPLNMDDELGLTLKILNKLRDYPNGVFCRNFPEIFQ